MPTVLVVEDDRDHQELLGFLLERARCAVRPVADGAQAVAVVQEMRPDLVVLNWRLPGPAGMELCRQLRSAPGMAAVPVLMMTAWAPDLSKEDLHGVRRTGVDDVMSVFDPQDFIARVQALLTRFPPAEG